MLLGGWNALMVFPFFWIRMDDLISRNDLNFNNLKAPLYTTNKYDVKLILQRIWLWKKKCNKSVCVYITLANRKNRCQFRVYIKYYFSIKQGFNGLLCSRWRKSIINTRRDSLSQHSRRCLPVIFCSDTYWSLKKKKKTTQQPITTKSYEPFDIMPNVLSSFRVEGADPLLCAA